MRRKTEKQLFLESFDLYSDAIYRFCVVKTSNTELAKDLTQETFTRYWQTLRNKRSMQNPRAFLYTIAQHLVIDWYRKKKSLSLDALKETRYEPQETGTMTAESRAQYEEIRSVIDQLPEDQQLVLILRYVEGLGPKDIAEMLAVSANVVSVRIDRALKKVRAILNGERQKRGSR
ncbi:MAG: RNA polymerase sigma factor, partial [Patescibacteria group bacterium]|nr:RNA polymerase sigma factor [Patescibacteria group bacterium]